MMTLGELRALTNGMPDETLLDFGDAAECMGLQWAGATPAECVEDGVVAPPRISLVAAEH